MIVAIVLMLVFFVLGLAVLTGASVTTASVNARIHSRQAYYFARSTLDVLDESLRGGELGDYVRTLELGRLLDSGQASLEEAVALSLPLSLAGGAPEGLRFTDDAAALSYRVVSERINEDLISITLENVLLSFRAEHMGKGYGVSVSYTYAGFAERQGGRWTWSDAWRLEDMA
jgi:hypothetical protein